MPQRRSYIAQSTIFETIGKPDGYDDLPSLQRHYMRQSARSLYDVERGRGLSHEQAAQSAFNRAEQEAEYYTAQHLEAEAVRTCGANAKRSGQPCKLKPLPGRRRCKYHGGASTGPQSLAGKIKALSSLKQYKARPDLLAAHIEHLKTSDGEGVWSL